MNKTMMYTESRFVSRIRLSPVFRLQKGCGNTLPQKASLEKCVISVSRLNEPKGSYAKYNNIFVTNFYKALAKFILHSALGVQNLFCIRPLECKIYFAFAPWSAKFILRRKVFQIYFAKAFVPNLFCEGQN